MTGETDGLEKGGNCCVVCVRILPGISEINTNADRERMNLPIDKFMNATDCNTAF